MLISMPGDHRENVLSWCPNRRPKSDDLHGSLTVRTLKDRPGLWFTRFNQDLQNHLDQQQQLFGVAMQKAIISDAAKAFWQKGKDKGRISNIKYLKSTFNIWDATPGFSSRTVSFCFTCKSRTRAEVVKIKIITPNQRIKSDPKSWRFLSRLSGMLAYLAKEYKMNIDEIKKMSTVERLQAMEALWDSMQYENDKIDTPKWHENILEERKRIIANGSAKFISLAKLKASRDKWKSKTSIF